MKKIISILLCAVIVFSLAACNNNENPDETSSGLTENNSSNYPVVSLLGDTDAAPGDTVTVNVHVANGFATACFDFFVYEDEKLEYESAKKAIGDPDFYSITEYGEDEDSKGCLSLKGYVMTVFDLPDDDVFTVTYKVSEKAQSGDELKIEIKVDLYQVGLDENGNEVVSVEENVTIENLTITVK